MATESQAMTGPYSLPRTPATVLLVDDSASFLGSTREILEAHGYRVHVASDGEQAVELSEALGDEIDLLILDIRLPGISGLEVAGRVRADRPDRKVVFMSSSVPSAFGPELLDGAAPFLQKPFRAAALLEACRGVLGA